MQDATFLFTDIEGSTRLWEEQPERMRPALARHDAIVREAVESHSGRVVKMTGDGVHAVFADAMDALRAALALQAAMPRAAADIELRVRCGVHAGPSELRDGDHFGAVVNRAARIMAAAHGGQVLMSRAVADRVRSVLPQQITLRDLGAVRLRDLADPEHVYQLLHAELRAEFPALRSLERTPNNLPHEVTSFVGRRRELSAVGELLRAYRLVTVVGMGGMGKSRLAIHAAADSIDEHPDGAWIVELGGVSDPALVTQGIAAILGVPEEPGRLLLDTLQRHVRDRGVLLVLDNCEHLVAEVARAARALLEAGPRVRILATSREPLQVAGEAVFPLSSLAFPGPLAAEGVDPSHYDAVRLFVERAAAADPDFRMTVENGSRVVAICNRLDGIPLALELAAARVRALPVDELAARLHDKFRLLRSSDPTVLPRQRTLLALIDWSHDLLDDDERRVFRQCAIFTSSWTLEGAEAVCDPGPPDAGAIADLLGRLVEKSLVVLDRQRSRYHMLETVGDYARRRLGESDDRDATRARHLAYFLELAQRAATGMRGPDQANWLARIDLERDNILAAHAGISNSSEDARAGLLLASAMRHYWITRGLLELGDRVTAEALGREGSRAPTELRCRALFDSGQLRYFMGQYGAAREVLEDSLAIARLLQQPKRIEAVLQPLGMAALAMGDHAVARGHLTEALAIARALDSPRDVATACNVLGQLMRVESSLPEAAALFEETLARARELQDHEVAAMAQLNLAMVCLDQAATEKALELLHQSWDIAESLGSQPLIGSALEVTAAAATARGEGAIAARFYGAAMALSESTRLRPDPADALFVQAWTKRCRAAVGAEAFAREAGEGHEQPTTVSRADARAWIKESRKDLLPSPCR